MATDRHLSMMPTRRATAAALAASLLAARAAHAHVGRAPEPHDLWQSWSWPPLVVGGLLLAAWSYGRGLAALRRRAGRARGHAAWRSWCFAAGWLAAAIALVSPVDAVSAALFSMHMVQHLLLVMVAAPLLLLGEPALLALWALPLAARRSVARAWRRAHALRALWHTLTLPVVAWALHVLALWAWHLPRLYEAALRSEALHALEHASFFLSALLFWWLLVDRRARRRLGVGTSLLLLFTMMLQSTALGAFITVARRPWYPAHFATTGPWGLTPLEDQQLAGLIMWVPAGLVYLAFLAAIVARHLNNRGARGARGAGVTAPAAAPPLRAAPRTP